MKNTKENPINGKEILKIIDALTFEKNIAKEQIFSCLEKTLLKIASKKNNNYDLHLEINKHTGVINFFKKTLVVDDNYLDYNESKNLYEDIAQERYGLQTKIGDVITEPVNIDFSRVSSVMFKQILKKSLEELLLLEQSKLYKEKIGSLFYLKVKKNTNNSVIVQFDNGLEGVLLDNNLPKKQNLNLKNGDKLIAVLSSIEVRNKIHFIFDNHSTEYFNALLQSYVSGIKSEDFSIIKIVRRPDEKAIVLLKKNAPYTEISNIKIEKKLNDLIGLEVIEFIEYSSDFRTQLFNIFQHHSIKKIEIEEDNNSVSIVFSDKDFNIKKESLNFNKCLYEQLLNCSFNFYSETFYNTVFLERKNKAIELFSRVLNIDNDFADILFDEGFEDIETIVYCKIEELTFIEGLSIDIANDIREQGKAYLELINKPLIENFMSLGGVDLYLSKFFIDCGIKSISDLADLSTYELVDLTDIDFELAQKIILNARKK